MASVRMSFRVKLDCGVGTNRRLELRWLVRELPPPTMTEDLTEDRARGPINGWRNGREPSVITTNLNYHHSRFSSLDIFV